MNKKESNPLVYLWRMLWRYSAGNRRTVILYSLMSAGAVIVWSLEPLVVGLLLNEVQENGVGSGNAGILVALVVAFFGIEVFGWLLHGPSRVMETENAFNAKVNYKTHLLKGVLAYPIEWHSDHHSGDTIDKIEKGASGLYGFGESTFQVIHAVVALVVGLGALFYFDVYAGIAATVLILPTFYILTLFDRKLVPGYKKVSFLENDVAAKVFDVISNVTSVIILRVESLVLQALSVAVGKPKRQFMTNSRINEWKWFSASTLGRVASIAVIGIYLVKQFSVGAVMVGTIYILYGYVDRIRNVFFTFAHLYNDIIRWRAYVSNAEELSKDFRERQSQKENHLPPAWSTLSIQNLSFAYQNGSTDMQISDVCMNIRKGERIALIGESGGGKSTFLKLLRDLYHPKTLTLLVDGTPTPQGFVGIENSISLVPQDPEIFSTTIRENLTVGVEYPESHIKVFTDMAAFSDVVTRLPKGLESSIVEKGVNLSGGEKQRLALARGLLASEHKDIILLDEPTSSVDFGNELKIYQNIFEAFPEKTIISSIHRLHLLSLFDSVYLFKSGRIVASGKFEDLKQNSDDFKELWERYVQTRDAVNETSQMR
ncbi:ABC transporter ATP-binding protein/permease [Patescibacteria group bacterium]|nr:ABC transporter ATP-binding protein/permease [Patescibacteria group bacterium]